MDCPYCHVAFEKFPSRKVCCSNCGEWVHPKRRPVDPAGVKVLLTTAQAEEVDNDWSRKIINSQTEAKHTVTGMTTEQLAMLCQPGTAAEDFVYLSLQKALANYTIIDHHRRSCSYHLLGGMAWEKGEVDKAIAFHRKGFFYDVRRLEVASSQVSGLKIAFSPDERVCLVCAAASKSFYSLDNFLSVQPLPLSSCEMLARTKGAGCLTVLTQSDDWEE